MSSDPASWSNAIQNWYEERNNFVYGVGPKSSSSVVGHYTQVRETNENTFATNALIQKASLNYDQALGRQVAQSVKCLTLDFGSGP